MKAVFYLKLLLTLTIFSFFSWSCSSGGSLNSAEESLDTATVAARIQSSASALLPDVGSEEQSEDTSLFLKNLTYSDEEDWEIYTNPENVVYLEDIFGNVTNGPVTQVRVLVAQFTNSLQNLFTSDPNVDCSISTILSTSGDTIGIAFFGEIDNGTPDNPFFQCFFQEENETTLYGIDADNIVRVVSMTDVTATNEEQVEIRGDQQRIMQVVYVQYAERTEESEQAAYLELQYNQASINNGPDGEFNTADDSIFKSRSAIAGRAILQGEDTAEAATGDFFVTKFDQGLNQSDEIYTTTTQTAGRGSYTTEESFLFNINSDVSSFEGIPGIFCLQMPLSGNIPEVTSSSNCSIYETDFAWGDVTFPFVLASTFEQNFEDITLFTSDDTTLIESNGDNFSIPIYQ